MDYNQDRTGGGKSWSTDQADWATEDERRFWNDNDGSKTIPSNLNWEPRQSQSQSGSEPLSKKLRSSSSQDGGGGRLNRSKAIRNVFFKTQLCRRFRAGTCPYITNCNFAHSNDELRRPQWNWEEFQIPTVGSLSFVGEGTRGSYKSRHCKKFYTQEGCPYGDNCTFIHDEESKNRESVAISLGPGGYGGSGGGEGGSGGASGSAGGGSGSDAGGNVVAAGNGANSKPSNWKTRSCHKWEMTGYCPFGYKCRFAHGATELHKYGGGLIEGESRESASIVVASATPVANSDVHHIGAPSQRPSNVIQKPEQRPLTVIQRSSTVIQTPEQRKRKKWPDKLNGIYGDWIDNI